MIHRLGNKATASDPCRKDKIPSLDQLQLVNEDSILFCWVDELEDSFTHSSGIQIARTLDKRKDRWGKVLKVHPSVKDIKSGDYILTEKTHDVFGAVWKGLELWMTSSKDLVFVTEDSKFTETFV
jgi:hypothetical protein